MEHFKITPTKDYNENSYLDGYISAYYHSDYLGGEGRWCEDGTIENMICTLKNDITPCTNEKIKVASDKLHLILLRDLQCFNDAIKKGKHEKMVVCVVPRAKVKYESNQLFFRKTVSNVVKKLPYFIDGTNFILRQVDTKTTHRAKYGYGGYGEMPYPGITEDTCEISDEVKGKDILLIDDVYTKTINIDEDAIQALLNKGAKSVVFYAVGKTVSKY